VLVGDILIFCSSVFFTTFGAVVSAFVVNCFLWDLLATTFCVVVVVVVVVVVLNHPVNARVSPSTPAQFLLHPDAAWGGV